MFLVFILFFYQSFFAAQGLLTPTELYSKGYGLPSCPTIQGMNLIITNVIHCSSVEISDDEKKHPKVYKQSSKKKSKKNKYLENDLSVQGFGDRINIGNVTGSNIININSNNVKSSVNIFEGYQPTSVRSRSNSNDDSDEDKKKKKKDDGKALLAGAVAVGAIGVGAYVWDFINHKEHPLKGCDYVIDENALMTNGVWYETHHSSRWSASTLVTWPDFHMGQKPMQVNFPHFYSQGIISFDNRVFVYGRDFSSLHSAVKEIFYMKEIDPNGACLNSVLLPCKPKKIVHLNGTFYMLSYDGYLYYKAEEPNFTRFYIKKSEKNFFEETVIDVLVSSNHLCVVVWTDSGQLIQISNHDLSGFPIVKPYIITTIPMQERGKYRIVECLDGNFSLVKNDDSGLVMISEQYSFVSQNAIENQVYRKDELPFLKRTSYEIYRFIVNRPFKFVGIFCMGLSLFFYMRYLRAK